VFESIQAESAGVRLRNAAVFPMAAYLFTLAYLTLYPLLERVPAALFWLVPLVLLAGGVTGAVLIVRIVRATRMHEGGAGWLVAATLIELLCVWQFLRMTVPWL
jgi:hypothetical protein